MVERRYDLARDAIRAESIAAGAVGTEELADSAVTTAKLATGAVTKAKLGYKVVTVTVAAGATSGSSAADSELVGGEILGIYPAGNQDQFVTNVVLNADGSITVTLGAAATADNTFKVVVLKP